MDTNKIEGAARDAFGRLKDGTGGVTGDLGLQVAGKIDQVGGRLQKEYGSTVDDLKSDAADLAHEARRSGSRLASQASAMADRANGSPAACPRRIPHCR